jgi:hypothetical protein
MHPIQTENGEKRADAQRSRYVVVNHKEAGLFDSMTAATLWALKHLPDWDWQIEPVSTPLPPAQ